MNLPKQEGRINVDAAENGNRARSGEALAFVPKIKSGGKNVIKFSPSLNVNYSSSPSFSSAGEFFF